MPLAIEMIPSCCDGLRSFLILLRKGLRGVNPSYYLAEASKPRPRTPVSLYTQINTQTITYDHRTWKIRDPVRSPIDKPGTARLVVGSVTTSESLVLYVFFSFFFSVRFSLS
ncbi:hypothetical protein F4804DRAFT_46463 [Jackrogersella minutella]|nr:hypothetical protein F4804DRAFT_46463 [Jackrogersella minutella]